MSEEGKLDILKLVEDSGLPRSRALFQLRLPRSTYYRWLKRLSENRLTDKKGGSEIPWNKLKPEEATKVLEAARASPDLSCRQLACTLTDHGGMSISESSIYRILKLEGLIRPAEIIGWKAAKEYHRKTTRVHELWASDCCHLRVEHWGWYYLETVLDDYSRFILGSELKTDMAGRSLEEVMQQAVDFTGMTEVPVEDRSVLLTDNGAGYISQQFNQYLRLVGIRHITASPFHPQTNGKIERYHRSLKNEIGRIPYDTPDELREAIRAFVKYYNYQRYHEGLGNVTPYDVYTGRHTEIFQKRKETKESTLSARKDYNRSARKQEQSP